MNKENVVPMKKKAAAPVPVAKPKNRAAKRAAAKASAKPKKFVKSLGKIHDVQVALFGDNRNQLGIKIIFAFGQNGVFVGHYAADTDAEISAVDLAGQDAAFVTKIREILVGCGVSDIKHLIGLPVEANVAEDFSDVKSDWRILSEVL